MALGCLKSQEAVDLLHHCLEDGEIVPGKHFREELAKEHLSFEDAGLSSSQGESTIRPKQTSRPESGNIA